MSYTRSTHRCALSCMAVLALLAGANRAQGADVYTAPNALAIPLLRIGTATYSNVLLTIGSIVSAPSGTSPHGNVDTYDPVSNQLTIPAVLVGATTYYNAVVSVSQLTSIGGVSGADTFDGAHLRIPYVVVGAASYYNVVLAVSIANVAAVHDGMPGTTWDQYDAATGKLTIPVVRVGSNSYTNAVLNVGPGAFVSAGFTESVLYSLGSMASGDGNGFTGSPLQASDGNFYALTGNGGAHARGAAIKITPDGHESVLYSFGANAVDGVQPTGSLIQARDGNFYGMTLHGGPNDVGTVFKITPAGVETVLHPFSRVGDGYSPLGSLLQASDGNFYGMTQYGGSGLNGGVVFKITPTGGESILYSFLSVANDGGSPQGSLIQAKDGNLYGMTYYGGTHGQGAVFRINLSGAETVLHSFGAISDGSRPYGDLIQASDGNFYGMTYGGGANGYGTVFKMMPDGIETVIYSFYAFAGDSAFPSGSLIQASDGNFYGMTTYGGPNSHGTVFRMTPAGTETIVHLFGGGADGVAPFGSLIQARDANLYGLTFQGGVNTEGALIKITW
jgi:uncharacterized repeat protein (TIGR03803 family)